MYYFLAAIKRGRKVLCFSFVVLGYFGSIHGGWCREVCLQRDTEVRGDEGWQKWYMPCKRCIKPPTFSQCDVTTVGKRREKGAAICKLRRGWGYLLDSISKYSATCRGAQLLWKQNIAYFDLNHKTNPLLRPRNHQMALILR